MVKKLIFLFSFLIATNAFAQSVFDPVNPPLAFSDSSATYYPWKVIFPGANIYNYSTGTVVDVNGASLATTYLKLDQSTPQTVTASPNFNWLTATRIPYVGALGVLTDSANITTNGTNVNVGTLTTTTGGVTLLNGGGIKPSADSATSLGMYRADGTTPVFEVNTVTGSIDWTGSNEWQVPIGADLQTAINNATAGDTLILAAGTYTITSGLTVNKKLHIMGQGEGITTITSASDIVMIDMQTTSSAISDMTISSSGTRTGSNTKCAILLTAGCNIYNIEFLDSTTGATNVYYETIRGVAGTTKITNCSLVATGAIAFNGFYMSPSGSTAAVTIDKCNFSCSGGTSASYGAMVIYHAASSTSSVSIYNSYITSPVTATSGVLYNNGAGASMSVYNSTLNGSASKDVSRDNGTVTLYNTTLVNNTTSGTITYGGTVASGKYIASVSATGADPLLYLHNPHASTNDYADIVYSLSSAYTTQMMKLSAMRGNNGSDADTDFVVSLYNAGGITEAMRLYSNRKLKVGAITTANDTTAGEVWAMNLVRCAEFEMIEDINTLVGTSNIKGFWVFDQTGATTSVTDRSPNAHTLTLGGNASTLTPSVSGLCPNLTMNGTAATAWSVADNDDFSFGNGAGVDTAFTIIVLQNPSSTATSSLCAKRSANTLCEYLFTWVTNKIWFGVSGLTGADSLYRYYNTSLIGDIGTWHCYAGTASGGSPQAVGGLKVYRDGLQIDDTSSTAGAYVGMTNSTAVLANSKNNASEWSSGKYGVVLIINKELTAAEVKRVSQRLQSFAGTFI